MQAHITTVIIMTKKRLTGENSGERIIDALMAANIPDFKISLQAGFWVIMHKQA